MIEWWIDIPNLQTVDLPYSFKHVQSKSITSICMNMNEWIDVSPILADLVEISITIHNPIELKSMNMNVENLIISSNSCNDLNELNLNEYRYLKSIEIGMNSFNFYYSSFVIKGIIDVVIDMNRSSIFEFDNIR